MRKLTYLGVASLGLFVMALHGQERLGLGHPPSSQELREWKSTVLPDGTGLPPGSGTPAEGKSIYLDKCSACHGEQGQGNGSLAPQLVGGVGTLKSGNPIRTVGSYWPYATTVWDFIYRAMPYSRPGTLTAHETYAVTAYLLSLNRIISPNAVLNQKTLPAVRMPNRDGFVPDSRPDVP